MLLSLFQAVACTLSLGGCGGGDGASQPQGVSTPATAPAAFPDQNPSGVDTSPPAAPAPAITRGLAFTFTLPAARTTSAGVYSSDGMLVRTLWRGRRFEAGAHAATWDQRDDGGTLLASGNYTVKVAHHDMQYVWEGAIGNTSARAGAAVLHHSYRGPTSFASIPGGMLYAVGYNEAQSAINGFRLDDTQLNQSPVRIVSSFVSPDMIAADGQRVYWTNTGLGMDKSTFVAANDIATNAQTVFSAGTPTCLSWMTDGKTCYASTDYKSVLDLRADNANPATGIAVQKAGTLLAVAYGARNEIHLFDKNSGQLLRTLPVALNAGTINQIAMSPSGDLWVLSGNAVVRYTNLDATPLVATTILTLDKPLAIAVDPHDDNAVWIADGGSSEQVKRFDKAGNLVQAIGVAGGYGTRTLVAGNRFNFTLGPGQERTTLAIDDNHAVWVLDTAVNRMLKFDADGSLGDQIAYLPCSYTTSTDAGNPTRVFANFMEYAVDYGKSLSDAGGWKLVRNWLTAVPADLQVARGGDPIFVSANWGWTGFRTVLTMSNGRTYALLGVGEKNAFVELTADGKVRFIQWLRDAGAGETRVVFYENGDLGWSSSDGLRQSVLRLRLQGFDNAANPVWASTPTVLATAPAALSGPADPPLTFTGVVGARFPQTSTGKVVFFNPSVDAATGFHLGAVVEGGSAWDFEASPSGPLDGLGTFQTSKDDHTLQYGGNLVHALGPDIVYGYHGEYYTDLSNGNFGEANQFMHFREDGLFIGQFGVASTRATSAAQPGLSGNAFSSTLLRTGGRTYLYHNDESTFGGVQRWRLAGIDDIQELSAVGSVGTSVLLN
ncbi:MAG: FlgD immunoglobulin-like domain containing protein [Betaproteobacteria bacterium]